MVDMKSIPIWVSFRLNSCEHKKRADWTPKWDFQSKWNLIPVWVHFAFDVNALLGSAKKSVIVHDAAADNMLNAAVKYNMRNKT